MQIADAGRKPRRFRQGERSANPDSPTMKALADRFLIRTFRFSSSTARTVESGRADVQRHADAAGRARSRARARSWRACRCRAWCSSPMARIPPTDASVADALLASKADALPVFTVGVGQETLAHDIQIGRVSTPRTALKGTSLLVDADRDADGLRGSDGHARRRGRRARSSGRSRCGCRPTAIPPPSACGSPPRMPGRACSISGSRRSPARSSPRTISATSRSTCAIAASGSSTSKASRASR